MAIKFYLMPEKLVFAIEILNYFFAAVFNIEAIMKIIAQG